MAFLNHAGWVAAPDAQNADLIIVNSCGFIQSAKQESINAVLGWRKLYPGKKIILAGCLAQRYAKELANHLPEADALFGVEDISRIVDVSRDVITAKHENREVSGKEFSRRHGGAENTKGRIKIPLSSVSPVNSVISVRGKGRKSSSLNPGLRPLLSLPGSAYVKISEGCNNRCTFCAIPLIRGHLNCRPVQDIVDECQGLLARGIRELCIIGQDIGSYRSGGSGLPELLKAIATLEGRFWVRLLYIHPDHFPLPILDIMEKDSRFLPYFDIPFQHASQKILTAMNRHGSAESYLSLVETIRRRLPHAVVRSTFLLGFPGETENDFADLLDFQEKARLDWLGCFAYSREEGTPAYSMPAQVSPRTAARRKKTIEERQVPITEKNMARFVGQNFEALIEEKFKSEGEKETSSEGEKASETLWLGRLYCHAPEVDGLAVITGSENLKLGEFAPCKIIAQRGFDLEGQASTSG